MKNGRHGQKFETPAEKKIALVHFPRQADFFFFGGGAFSHYHFHPENQGYRIIEKNFKV